MGFIFDPAYKLQAQDRLQQLMIETKKKFENAIPFAMEPVVYDFRINENGTIADLGTGLASLMPEEYYTLLLPGLLKKDLLSLTESQRRELEILNHAYKSQEPYSGFINNLFDRMIPHGQQDNAQQKPLNKLLDELGFNPEQHEQIKKELRSNYLSALKDSIVLKDIVQRHSIREVSLLSKLVDYLIDSPATLLSVNNIVKAFSATGIKTNTETISQYLQYLCEAFFIHESNRYDIRGKKILTGEKKYYLNDLAFKQYLTSGFDTGFSKYLENLVYLHYKRMGYTIYTGKTGDQEIDFIAEKNGIRKYIQVAYLLNSEEVIKREFGNLELVKDNFEKTVISMDDLCLGNLNGIIHLQAWEMIES